METHLGKGRWPRPPGGLENEIGPLSGMFVATDRGLEHLRDQHPRFRGSIGSFADGLQNAVSRKPATAQASGVRTKTSCDLLRLRRGFGFHSELKDARVLAYAAMVQTSLVEDHWSGGLDCVQRGARHRQDCSDTVCFSRSREWADWYQRASVSQMADLQHRLRLYHAIASRSVELDMIKKEQRLWTPKAAMQVLQQF